MNRRRKRKTRLQWPVFVIGIGLGVAATLALQYLILEDPISLSGIGVEPGRSAQDKGSVEREFPKDVSEILYWMFFRFNNCIIFDTQGLDKS